MRMDDHQLTLDTLCWGFDPDLVYFPDDVLMILHPQHPEVLVVLLKRGSIVQFLIHTVALHSMVVDAVTVLMFYRLHY